MSSNTAHKLVKIVYFDEESVSDILDIAAGGKEVATQEQTRERAAQIEANAAAKAAAKFNWLPFFGGSAEAGAAASATALGRSILSKTLSNTILTDYLGKVDTLEGVSELKEVEVSARDGSAAYMKMYTPYMAMMKTDDLPLNLAELDSALESAKGYYELVGSRPDSPKVILRFNIRAFRNSYGLVDLSRMDLVFHCVKVGKAFEESLSMAEEMSSEASDPDEPVTARGLMGRESPGSVRESLDVYDVLLAGVEYVA
ncbi:DUF6414 family protein [Gordonia amicalis]|uniref:DUF6414 family protein n=1 Tax=Gordonia amicalis TaxID=89053 RepID=UPI00295455FA|nr:DUF6414 family protein [Gordonia amicalis]MDV7102049.1 DUF6414 family protein [Gordonia amicalis]